MFTSLFGQDVSKTVKIGAYNNPPKIYQNSDGVWVGIFPDILNEIIKTEGWKIEYVPGTWKECLKNLEIGAIDCMVDVAYSLTRHELFDFNNEAVFINWAVIYSSPEFDLKNFIDLDGKQIAVMEGSIHTNGEEGIINQALNYNIKPDFIEVEDYTSVFRLIQEKKVHAGVVNRLFGAIYENDYNLIRSSIIFNPRHLKFAFPTGAALNNNLIFAIDAYLQEAKRDSKSVYHTILDYYLYDVQKDWLHREMSKTETPSIPLTDEEALWIRAHPLIRIGIDPEFFPFEYISENNDYEGIAADYVSLLNNRLGINMQVVFDLTWNEVTEGAKEKTIDVLPCVGMNEERKNFLNYTLPYINFHRVVITKMDFPFISGIEDLQARKVGVQRNTSHSGFLEENTDTLPVFYNSLQEALIALSDGKIDAFVGNIAASTYWIRELSLTNLKVAAPVYPGLDKLYFAVRSDWPVLVSILNKGLQSISEEEQQFIQNRWVTLEYEPGISKKRIRIFIIQVSIILGIVFLIIFFWIKSLKKHIALRKIAELQLEEYAGTLEEKVVLRTKELVFKQSELMKNIEEKEVLIHEIHHRVKNNVQTIISLLNLQFAEYDDKKTHELLGYSINRIRAIADAHEDIYTTENIMEVSIYEYVSNICSRAVESFPLLTNDINLIMDIPEINLSISQIIPLGLIINELISSSLQSLNINNKSSVEKKIKIGIIKEKDNVSMMFQNITAPIFGDENSQETLSYNYSYD